MILASKNFTVFAPHLNASQCGHNIEPTGKSCDKELLWNLWERSLHEMGNTNLRKKQIRGENNRKSGKKKYFNSISLAPDLWQLFPFWPSYGDSHFFVFCKMCNKFPFVVQWKMRCKQHTVCKLRFATFLIFYNFFPKNYTWLFSLTREQKDKILRILTRICWQEPLTQRKHRWLLWI